MRTEELALDENDVKLLNAVAALQIKFGYSVEAQKILELSLYLDPKKRQTNKILHGLYARSGMHEKAQHLLTRLSNTVSAENIHKKFPDLLINKNSNNYLDQNENL